MTRLDINCLATLNFIINWNSNQALHQEIYLARKVNLWRDIFPPGMKDGLMDLEKGKSISLDYAPGQAVPARKPSDNINTLCKNFTARRFQGRSITPRPGRFYPRGMLGGVHFFPQDQRPCRVLSIDDKTISSDLAHPLSDYPLSIKVRLEDLAQNNCETGGRLSHWMEEILGTGPGMQAGTKDGATEYISLGALDRTDRTDDQLFYKMPRLINHIDAQADKFLCHEYGNRLKPGMRILDLMASMNSHLPSELEAKVDGLGLNQKEMDANTRLSNRIVHDLNLNPELPFANDSYDALLCSLSIEYAVKPYQLAREAARVLRPSGVFMIGFSNRWFPSKVTRIWQELHEFERMGLVLDTLDQTGHFKDLETVSIRNWWRPEDDPHIDKTWLSDPIYLVAGKKK
ncbi:class I SAM-dependent methyltransferase [Desulfonatronovibrio hydrogenovorans]|uniref:class I SAM-dependent methyltransferase n=1 Tax=Desulfonatronovibrio hydrogenovorans TaxID=53245 RepID=UPI0004909DAF|nr:methyltransferase domain-containing protein [Desulfonatronovibrio hydrogenovorans]